jgi:hypothetical protein
MPTRKRKAVKVKDYAEKQRNKPRYILFKEWLEKGLEKNGVYTYPAFEE